MSTAVEALAWATSVGAPDVDDAPPIPEDAGDLLRRLDFPIPSPAAVESACPPARSHRGPEAA